MGFGRNGREKREVEGGYMGVYIKVGREVKRIPLGFKKLGSMRGHVVKDGRRKGQGKHG